MNLELPLHPILVHFPIALLITGFLIDLAGAIFKRPWLMHAGLLLLVLGSLGTVAATRSGEAAEDQILETPAIHETLEEHEEGGKRTMWFFLALTAIRGGLTWWGRVTPVVRWLFLVVWAAGLVMLFETAYHGGELVYHHGAGISAAPRPSD